MRHESNIPNGIYPDKEMRLHRNTVSCLVERLTFQIKEFKKRRIRLLQIFLKRSPDCACAAQLVNKHTLDLVSKTKFDQIRTENRLIRQDFPKLSLIGFRLPRNNACQFCLEFLFHWISRHFNRVEVVINCEKITEPACNRKRQCVKGEAE